MTDGAESDEDKWIDQLRFGLNKMKNYYVQFKEKRSITAEVDLRLTPSRMTFQIFMINFKFAIGSLSQCPWILTFLSRAKKFTSPQMKSTLVIELTQFVQVETSKGNWQTKIISLSGWPKSLL
ncbi:hypothetical protein HAX54_039833 [Datura stramonium]|uniref:PH domain-containing protein n=1 Tax=Datura stramonium TaxID=4076 RepID=A0ABS8VLV9_DATST|nr:hypothetical protein [Datura stramonium]